MIAFIGSIIKYSFVTVTVLILSHVIHIGDVTVSDYVKSILEWTSIYSPSTPKGITEAFSRSMNGRLKEVDQIDSEVSPQDQRELDRVIENSQGRK